MAKIVEFIYTEELIGNGTQKDPYRRIRQLWTKDGRLVAQEDPIDNKSFFKYEI